MNKLEIHPPSDLNSPDLAPNLAAPNRARLDFTGPAAKKMQSPGFAPT